MRRSAENPEIIQDNLERKVRTVEKISKEELMKKLGMTEEEMGKVSGGESLEEYSFLCCGR